jgi:hypothetical protein
MYQLGVKLRQPRLPSIVEDKHSVDHICLLYNA